MFKRLLQVLLVVCATLQAQAQTGYDTLRVLFPINVTSLDRQATAQLDSLARNHQGQALLIYGYADYLGNTPANKHLAADRAHNVAAYLRKAGISDRRIMVVAGIGEVPRAVKNGSEGYPEDRRVFVFIRRDAATNTPVPVNESRPAVADKAVQVKQAVLRTDIPAPAQGGAAITSELADVASLKPDQSFPIRNLNFEFGSWSITPGSVPALDELYRALAANPGLFIRLEGHICCTYKGVTKQENGPDSGLDLSWRRVMAVKRYLERKGIAAARIAYIGYGGTRHLVEERTAADEALNRRVEVRVLRNDR